MLKTVCMVAYTTYAHDARVMREAQAAAREGFAVDVITPKRASEKRRETVDGVNLHRLRPGPYTGSGQARYLVSYGVFFVQCLILISWLQPRRRYRVIHINNMPDFLVFSAVAAKLLGARIILDIHDPMPEMSVTKFGVSRRSVLYRLLVLQERWSAAFADTVLTVHEPLKRDVLVKDGIEPGKITVVANFADGNVFRIVRPFTVAPPLRLVYHGTIAARFGFAKTLRALANVRGRERFSLKIIGEGDYQGPLRRLIRDLDLGRTVDFENRQYPLTRLPEVLRSYHLGFVPYERSPATELMLPVKLLELLAMGIPAVTVANTPVRFYLKEDMYFAYNPDDMPSLTDLLDRILDDPSVILGKREAILGNRERLLWEGERRKYADLLRDLSYRG